MLLIVLMCVNCRITRFLTPTYFFLILNYLFFIPTWFYSNSSLLYFSFHPLFTFNLLRALTCSNGRWLTTKGMLKSNIGKHQTFLHPIISPNFLMKILRLVNFKFYFGVHFSSRYCCRFLSKYLRPIALKYSLTIPKISNQSFRILRVPPHSPTE